jgi:Zn-finger nucleic acid-binding protein
LARYDDHPDLPEVCERHAQLLGAPPACGGTQPRARRPLFLDRSELEKLVAAENEWHGTSAAPAPAPPRQDRSYAGPQDRGYQQGDDQHSDHRYDDRHENRYDQRGYQQRPYKKKKSFLSELFDD